MSLTPEVMDADIGVERTTGNRVAVSPDSLIQGPNTSSDQGADSLIDPPNLKVGREGDATPCSDATSSLSTDHTAIALSQLSQRPFLRFRNSTQSCSEAEDASNTHDVSQEPGPQKAGVDTEEAVMERSYESIEANKAREGSEISHDFTTDPSTNFEHTFDGSDTARESLKYLESSDNINQSQVSFPQKTQVASFPYRDRTSLRTCNKMKGRCECLHLLNSQSHVEPVEKSSISREHLSSIPRLESRVQDLLPKLGQLMQEITISVSL